MGYTLTDKELSNLPPCKQCGRRLEIHKITRLADGLNISHACGDGLTIISLQSNFNATVRMWCDINKGDNDG